MAKDRKKREKKGDHVNVSKQLGKKIGKKNIGKKGATTEKPPLQGNGVKKGGGMPDHPLPGGKRGGFIVGGAQKKNLPGGLQIYETHKMGGKKRMSKRRKTGEWVFKQKKVLCALRKATKNSLWARGKENRGGHP